MYLRNRLCFGEVVSDAASTSDRPRFQLVLEDTVTGQKTRVATRALVIAAGLHAQAVAESIRVRSGRLRTAHAPVRRASLADPRLP